MKLVEVRDFDAIQSEKVDLRLLSALLDAQEDDSMRVILALEIAVSLQKPVLPKPVAKDFRSVRAYREALIQYQEQNLADEIDQTVLTLKELGLSVNYSGQLSKILIAEGAASSIFDAIKIPQVRCISLDQVTHVSNGNIATDQEVESMLPIFTKAYDFKTSFLSNLLGNNPREKLVKESIGSSIRQYIGEYKSSYQNVQILRMQKPLNLDSIYIESKVNANFISSSISVESVEEAFQVWKSNPGRHVSKFATYKQKDGFYQACERDKLLVLGEPGSGKSIFLRKIGLEAFKGKNGKLSYSKIPFLFEVRKFDSDEVDILSEIVKKFKQCGFNAADNVVQNLLESGDFLILLDGIDEVPSNARKGIVNSIRSFVVQYNKNRFVLSCRTAARPNLSDFFIVEILPFSRRQVRYFVKGWFQAIFESNPDDGERFASSCIKALESPQNIGVIELTHTPLLLVFLCLTYRRHESFAHNRADLYDKALSIVLDEWSAAKVIERDSVLQMLKGIEKELLSNLAFNMFNRGEDENYIFFNKESLIENIENWLLGNKQHSKRLSGEKVLNALSVQQGILVERARNIYSFSHLNLQEYLAAWYISQGRQQDQYITTHRYDVRWREIFLMLMSIFFREVAGESLRMMLGLARQDVKSLKLIELLKWTNQRINALSGAKSGEGDTSQVGYASKRAVLLECALKLAYPLAKNHAVAQESLSRSIYLVSSIKKESYEGESNILSFPEELEFARNLLRAWDASNICAQSDIYGQDRRYFDNLKRIIYSLIEPAKILQTRYRRSQRQRLQRAEAPPSKRDNFLVPNQLFSFQDLPQKVERLRLIVDSVSNQEVSQAFFQDLIREMWGIAQRFFLLNDEMLNISTDDALAIEKYLYVQELIRECQYADIERLKDGDLVSIDKQILSLN